MTIYGVGILAACFIIGQLTGELLGRLLNINANVGGVGFAMLALIISGEWLKKKKLLSAPSLEGIQFWNAMYIPIIVAMSSIQNVRAAFSTGYVAILAGIIPTVAVVFLVPYISRLSKKQ
ncbi:malonate transporter subunit MadL [soil metagenome]